MRSGPREGLLRVTNRLHFLLHMTADDERAGGLEAGVGSLRE